MMVEIGAAPPGILVRSEAILIAVTTLDRPRAIRSALVLKPFDSLFLSNCISI